MVEDRKPMWPESDERALLTRVGSHGYAECRHPSYIPFQWVGGKKTTGERDLVPTTAMREWMQKEH